MTESADQRVYVIALDAERGKRARRKRRRDEGIANLRKHNIFVDFLPISLNMTY